MLLRIAEDKSAHKVEIGDYIKKIDAKGKKEYHEHLSNAMKCKQNQNKNEPADE